MNKDPRTIDEESRKKIRENIKENYFVEAGAGSGKTTVLVERMAKMIEEGLDISHISAITFTKAAANEFYERFQKKLVEKSIAEVDQTKKDKYLYALQNIDLAFMGTIDSFCNMIMSEHPIEAKIPSDAEVIDNDAAQELYKREYANIQNGLYNNKELEEKAKTFLHYNSHPEELFISTLNSLLVHRDCELVIPAYSKESIDEKYKDEIKTIRKIVTILNKNHNFFNCKNDECNDKVIKAFDRFEKTFKDSWEENIPNFLYAYSKTFADKGFRLIADPLVEESLQEGIDYFVLHEGKKKWYELNKDKLPKIIQEIEDNKYAVTLDFVDSAKELILAKLRKEGKLTFNDYLVYLRDTLKKDAKQEGKLIKHIYHRHKYFLIDEFQDTDPIQAEIFFYLAAEDIKEDWRACVPHKGSLFIVGDPKQSIYRFKNADVASYLKVEEMFKEPVGEVLYLYKNFRSTNKIKEWFNSTFSTMLLKSDDQAPYEDIPIDTSENSDGFTGIYKYEEPSTVTQESDKDEKKVRDIILKLYDNNDYQIAVKNNKENTIIYRKLDWKDFMLITPSKPALAKYTKVFREAGIPYFVEGNIVFSESKAFEMFVYFYGSIINPNDNRYLYNILKSNLFNINDGELNIVKNDGYNLSPYMRPDNKYSASFNKAIETINDYHVHSKTLSPSSLFTKIINEIDGFKKQGTENMEYVYFALELLKSKETNKQIITHLDALAFFEKLLYEKNEQERCPGLKKDGNQVHLANLHKVKGLEAPVVILAHPRRKARDVDFRITRQNNTNKGYLFNVSKTLSNGSSIKLISTTKYDEPFKSDEQTSSQAEILRLEYVAATRAKNILIISSCTTKDGLSKENMWLDLINSEASKKLNDIEAVLANVEAKPHNKPSIEYSSIPSSDNIFKQNENNLSVPIYETKNPSKLAQSNINEDSDIDKIKQKHALENNGDTLATITGTMAHRMMEMLVLSKGKVAKIDAISAIINENLTTEFIDKTSYFESLLENIYDTMTNGGYPQKGKAPQDILPILLNADNCYPEVPFTYLDENNKLWNGIIDLIYEKDNKLHIIDYKTNKSDENLDEHYKDQLNAYINSVKATLHKDVEDALIYHLQIK